MVAGLRWREEVLHVRLGPIEQECPEHVIEGGIGDDELDARLAMRDRAGVEMQVLSASPQLSANAQTVLGPAVSLSGPLVLRHVPGKLLRDPRGGRGR